MVALGIMVGRDVAGYLGHRVQREIYGEASEPVGDPEYDQAEEVWANGDHLEAIRLLREFLNNKPSKLHAAFRIAESTRRTCTTTSPRPWNTRPSWSIGLIRTGGAGPAFTW